MPEETQLSLVLERAHGLQRWELESAERDLSAIDDEEVDAFCDEAIVARRAKFDPDASVADVLQALHLLDSDDEPNRGAIALFGRPDALAGQYSSLGCRLVAVAGTELEDELLDDVLTEDNAFASMRRAMSFCEQHLYRPVRIRGGL